MSSAARLRKLIRPILDRNPDLILVGKDTLWLRPVEHMGRQIHFRRGRADYFTLQWHLSVLFAPALWVAPNPGSFYDLIGRSSLPFDRPGRMWPPKDDGCLYRSAPPRSATGPGLWIYDDETMPDDLIHQIEAVLRLMRSLNTLEKCVAFLSLPRRSTLNQIEHRAMLMDLVMGDIDGARDVWRSVRARHRAPGPDEPMDFYTRIALRWSELDAPLMAGDRMAIAALLGRWETENVGRLALHDAWTLMPFPFEKLPAHAGEYSGATS